MSIVGKASPRHTIRSNKDDQFESAIKRRSRTSRFGVQKRKNDGRPWKTAGRRETAVSAFYGGIKLLLNDARKVLLAAPLSASSPLDQNANHPGPPTYPPRSYFLSCEITFSPSHFAPILAASFLSCLPLRSVLVSICPRVQI